MGWRSSARILLASACLYGCAALAGLESPPSEDVGIVAPPREGGAVDDAQADAAPCTSSKSPGADGVMHASRGAVQIDGKFEDWDCAARIEVTDGAYSKNIPKASTFDISAQWDEANVFLYGRASTSDPGGDQTGNQIFRNDSLHFYLGRLPRQATYQSSDLEIVFDHLGRGAVYRNGVSVNGLTIDSKVARINGSTLTIEVELRVPREVLQVGEPLAAGQRFFIDAQLNDYPGNNEPFGYRTWFLAPKPTCGCTAGCCDTSGGDTNLPYCDPRCTGELVLE